MNDMCNITKIEPRACLDITFMESEVKITKRFVNRDLLDQKIDLMDLVNNVGNYKVENDKIKKVK